MATTAQLIGWVADGVIDAAGVNLASGVVRIYDPGTTTTQTVYSDSAASSAISQPITLDAYGRKTIYTKNLFRIVIKDSTDTTTLYDFDPANATRAEQVVITNSVVNSGTETTLNAWITSLGDSTSLYKATSAATARTVNSWLREAHIYPSDFGGVGNGVADDTTAIQAALAAVMASDRTDSATAQTRVFVLPAGTWLVSSAPTATVASGNTPIILRGQGSTKSIIKQSGTAANGLTLNWSVGSTDAKVIIEGIGWTCSTTSSGAAISVTNANNTVIRDCASSLFRGGFNVASATGCHLDRLHVSSTDGNASATGIVLGTETTVTDCLLAGSSNAGTGISGVGTNSDIRGCKISGFDKGVNTTGADIRIQGGQATGTTTAIQMQGNDCLVDGTKIVTGATNGIVLDGTDSKVVNSRIVATTLGIDMNGAGNMASHCRISGATTGIDMGAANCQADYVVFSTHTTGINVGAFAGCGATHCRYATVTTSTAVHATALTTWTEIGGDSVNSLSQRTAGRRMGGSYTFTEITGTATVIPTYEGNGQHVNVYNCTGTAGFTITIDPTLTTGLTDGDRLSVQIVNCTAGAGGTITMTWTNAAAGGYREPDRTNTYSPATLAVGLNRSLTTDFYWYATGERWIMFKAIINDF